MILGIEHRQELVVDLAPVVEFVDLEREALLPLLEEVADGFALLVDGASPGAARRRVEVNYAVTPVRVAGVRRVPRLVRVGRAGVIVQSSFTPRAAA